MPRSSLLVAVLSTLLILTHCGSEDIGPHQDAANLSYSLNLMSSLQPDKAYDQANITKVLAESAVSVTQSLKKLAQIERAVHPAAQVPPSPTPASIGMADLASVDWTGPAEPLLKKLAQASHYTLAVLGRHPTVPLLISINTHNTPIANIIRDLGYQIQRDADLNIEPKTKRVELRYH